MAWHETSNKSVFNHNDIFLGVTKYHCDCSKLACLIFILFVYKGESPLNIDIPNGTNNGIFIWCQNKHVLHHLSAGFALLENLN